MSSKPNTWTQIIEPVMRQALAEIVAYLPSTKAPVSAFRAYLASSATITGTANTQVIFTGVEYDFLNEYNPLTGIWTPRNAGVYLITAGIGISNTQNSGLALRVHVTDALTGSILRFLYYAAVASTSVPPNLNSADTLLVAAGTQYQITTSLQPISGTTTLLTGTGSTWFSATQLR